MVIRGELESMSFTESDMKTIFTNFIFIFVAPVLIVAISEISSAKWVAISSVLEIGTSVSGGWEIRLIFFALAGLLLVSIPTWGILRGLGR